LPFRITVIIQKNVCPNKYFENGDSHLFCVVVKFFPLTRGADGWLKPASFYSSR